MIVVKHPMNSKSGASMLINHTGNSSNTFDPYLFAATVGRGNQNFDTNFASDRWTCAAENQYSVERDIACKAPRNVLSPVVPMEENRQLQLVPNRPSVLRNDL
jgi:hypothetical protein